VRLGEDTGGLSGRGERPVSSPNPMTPRGSARHAGVPSPASGTGHGQAVSSGERPASFFGEVVPFDWEAA